MLFDARKHPVVHLSDDFSTYSHTVPGGMVRGYVYHPQGEDALRDLFIYFAGRGEDVRTTAVALHWLPEGFGFAAVNYRGVADSEGHPSEIASVEDAIQFANHLRRAFPSARLHVVGRSLGTGVGQAAMSFCERSGSTTSSRSASRTWVFAATSLQCARELNWCRSKKASGTSGKRFFKTSSIES